MTQEYTPWHLARRQRYRTRVFELARARGWSEAELARHCGLSQSALNRIRLNKRGVGQHAIQAILAAFPHLTFEDLFYLEDAPPDKVNG